MGVPSEPDNRINLQAPLVGFPTVTGQLHDQFPSPGQQARFDWMRSYLIGLLSNQSSYSPPTQYRDGTLWYDFNTLTLRIWSQGAWQPFAAVVALALGEGVSDTITLAEWYASTAAALTSVAPEIVYSGTCSQANTTTIPIPASLRGPLNSNSRPFVWINGLLLSPETTVLLGSPTPTTISLQANTMNLGDKFTVNIRNVLPNYFYQTNVSAP